jgi:hypothetical protein
MYGTNMKLFPNTLHSSCRLKILTSSEFRVVAQGMAIFVETCRNFLELKFLLFLKDRCALDFVTGTHNKLSFHCPFSKAESGGEEFLNF